MLIISQTGKLQSSRQPPGVVLTTPSRAHTSPANGVDDRVTLQYVNGKLILPEGRVELAPLASTMEDASPSPMSAGKSDEEELSESGSEEEEQFSDLYSDGELENVKVIFLIRNFLLFRLLLMYITQMLVILVKRMLPLLPVAT